MLLTFGLTLSWIFWLSLIALLLLLILSIGGLSKTVINRNANKLLMLIIIFFLLVFISANITLAYYISPLFVLSLWVFIYLQLKAGRSVYIPFWKGIILPIMVAIIAVFCGLPLWLYYTLWAIWLLLTQIARRLATRKLYWHWFFTRKNYSLYLYQWFEKQTTYSEWAAMLKRWKKRKDYEHIQDFVSSYFNIYSENMYKKDPVMSEKMRALLPMAHDYCRSPYLFAEVDTVTSFNILCHDELLFFFLTQARKEPIYMDSFVSICSYANQQIDAYVENPHYYPFLTTYFLKPDLLDKVERWQEVELAQLADKPDVQEKLQYFFGLHYMAIGIARNMPTTENETLENETSEDETSEDEPSS
jgi:hypothetical protein